jgi:hypothetical protein
MSPAAPHTSTTLSRRPPNFSSTGSRRLSTGAQDGLAVRGGRTADLPLFAAVHISSRLESCECKDDNPAVAYFSRSGATMSDQPAGEVPSETAKAWDTVRRIREPIAWALLALTAIILLLSACQLFNLADAKIPIASPPPVASSAQPVPVGSSPAPVPSGPSPAPVSAFALRASAVAPQFIQVVVQALPVLSVVLVAFCGGLTERARQVAQTAAVLLAAAFVLGLISLEGAASSHTRPGTWFILEAAGLAITATALFFTGAVMWSRELRSLAPGFQDLGDDEDFEDDPDFGEHD